MHEVPAPELPAGRLVVVVLVVGESLDRLGAVVGEVDVGHVRRVERTLGLVDRGVLGQDVARQRVGHGLERAVRGVAHVLQGGTPPDRSGPARCEDGPVDQPSGPGATADPGGRARGPRVTLVGKPGCHLCDDAKQVVAAVCAEVGVGWRELLITDDPDLAAQYWELVPVVLVDGVQHDYFRVDAARLRAALA